MKQLRPLSFVLAAVALCCAYTAFARDQEQSKNTRATAASYSAKKSTGAACTAEMAATCTPEMAAACAAKGMKGASAKNAAMEDCCAMKGAKATAVTASAKGGFCPYANDAAMTAEAGGCAMSGAKNTAMAAGSTCSAHGANAAMTAGSNCAPGAKGAAMTAGAEGCAMRGAKTAGMTSCGGQGMVRASGHSAHADCDACSDMDACDMALREAGASMQVVPLKNGVMYVYTTDPAKARMVQQTMAQRRDQMALFASSGSNAHLCNDCRQMRGAAMSGKLTREVVNIEGGCLSLMTSSDPAIVAKIHALAGVTPSQRAKI